MIGQRTALISVTAKDKPPIADFVRQLKETGPWRIISSGGTCKYLREAGFEVDDIADVIARSLVQQFENAGLGFTSKSSYQVDMGEAVPPLTSEAVAEKIKADPLLGHRVVTLSREKSAMLLAQYNAADTAELEALGLSHIYMVVCDFYALKKAIEAEGATTESVCKATDIGGPGMVSEAAKGRRIVICDPQDRQVVIDEMRENDGDITEATRNTLCVKADRVVAQYRLDGAWFHSGGAVDGVIGERFFELAKGESGAQSPAYLYSNASITYPLAWRYFDLISGLPGYVNMGDMDRVRQIMCRAAEAFRQNLGKCPQIVIACKHGNACGMGVDFDSPVEAVRKAMLGDPIAVMGGEIMTNFEVTDEIGEAMFRVPEEHIEHVGRKNWGPDVICASGFSEASVELLGKRELRKLLANSALENPVMNDKPRMIRVLDTDEFLVQGSPRFVLNMDELESLVGGELTQEDMVDMIIAWVCAWQADSNTASLANDGMLIGLGCGDQDRIWCFDEALRKAARAKHSVKGAKFGSDGFIVYPERADESRPKEGLELCVEAGCTGGVVPADGKNLGLVKAFVEKSGITVAFVPPEHRGFMFHA